MNGFRHRILAFAILSGLSVVPLRSSPDLDKQRFYLEIYLNIQEAEKLEKSGAYLESLSRFKWSAVFLERLRQTDPDWEEDLLAKRIKKCQDEVAKLEPLAEGEVLAPFKAPLSSGPKVTLLFDEGVRLENAKLYYESLIQFDEYQTSLEIIHRNYPRWEKDKIGQGLEVCKAKIDRLRKLILK
jgi:hypothetical protein